MKNTIKLLSLSIFLCFISNTQVSAIQKTEVFSDHLANGDYDESPLFEAIASYADEETAEKLIKQGGDVNFIRKIDKTTPLFWAAKHGLIKTVELLINHGALINVKDIDGDTPLLIATKKGYKDIVKLLVNNGAEINIINKKGENVLSIAKAYKYNEIIKFLEPHILNK